MKWPYKTVSNVLARRYVAASAEIGLSGQEVMRLAGLARTELAQGRLAAERFLRLSALFPGLPHQQQFLSGGLARLADDFPALAAVCANAETLEAAVTAYLGFRAVIAEVEPVQFHIGEDEIEVVFPHGMAGPRSKGAIAHFADLAALARHYGHDERQDRLKVTCALAGPPPADTRSVEESLHCRVLYHQHETLIRFRGVPVRRRYRHFDSLRHHATLERLRAEWQAVRAGESLVHAVHGVLSSQLMEGAGLSDVELLRTTCVRLNLTRSTLWRRLKQEGATYTGVLAQVRQELACRMLQSPRLSLAQISDQLGFAAPSAFSRFFKLRAGQSPREFRLERLTRLRASAFAGGS